MKQKYEYITVQSDEWNICVCGHKKIHHGGSHKIIPYTQYGFGSLPEMEIYFGCIECDYESQPITFSYLDGVKVLSTLKKCRIFTPKRQP